MNHALSVATSLVLVFGIVSRGMAQLTSSPVESNWSDVTAQYEAEALTLGRSAKVVDDAAASGHKAVAAVVSQGRAGHIVSGGWTPVKTDAAYEAAFRIRMDVRVVAPPDIEMPLYIGTEDKAASSIMGWPLRLEAVHRRDINDAGTESVVQWHFAKIPSPAAVKDYHDYVISFQHVPTGHVAFRVYWYGRAFCSVWIDKISLREQNLPSEAQQLAANAQPATAAISHQRPLTRVWPGMYHWTYRIPDLIGGACETGRPVDGVKQTPQYDVMFIGDNVLTSLSLTERKALAEFVKGGGGLVLLGGVYSYGKSSVHTSPILMDLLPVETMGLWDLRQAPKGGLSVKTSDVRFKNLRWDAGPRVYYYHQARPKADAQVWLKGVSGDGKQEAPLLVARPYGKGIVLAFLGTPLGVRQGQGTPIWEWTDWGRLLTIVTNAARGVTDDQGRDKPLWTWPKPTVIPAPPPPEPRKPTSRPAGKSFQISKVWPEKICFRPGTQAKGAVVVVNDTNVPASAKLVVSLHWGLDRAQTLKMQELALGPNAQTTIAVKWPTGKREFGHELRAQLVGPDGSVLDAKGEYFTVGWNNYRLGQCRVVQPWTFDQMEPSDPSRKTFPNTTPEDRWNVSIPAVRDAGAVVTEYFFWAPDDFGNLTPDKEMWFSGQGNYLISQADIHAVVDAAHANGIAAVTYGKKWMAISGQQGGRDGAELIRMHPQWCEWVPTTGHPKWWFSEDVYSWTFDQIREAVQTKGKGALTQGPSYIGGAAVNCYGEDTVRYGCEEIVRSARKYGWDGVRFDDHFTMDSVFDGGLGFDGQTAERGEDYEAITVRNNRMTREICWKYDPHFLVGFNYGGTFTHWGVRQPDAFVETCKDGQFVMIEHSGWWPAALGTWRRMYDVLTQENHRVQALGGVPGMCVMGGLAKPQFVSQWEAAINYASQGHFYNVNANPEVVKYTRFMLRYGQMLYDAHTQWVANPDGLLAAGSEDKMLWRQLVHQRQIDDTHRQIVASFINLNASTKIADLLEPPKPLENVPVEFTVPQGWKLSRAWCLDPDSQQVCKQLNTPADVGKLRLELPRLEAWNLLVFELQKL